MAATAEINTPVRPGRTFNFLVAAATLIYAGTYVAVDANGNAVPASDTAGLRAIGRAEQTVDNSAGNAGDLAISVMVGIFRFANSATNPASADDVLKMAYVEDNQTVATSTTHKLKAGRIMDVDDDGVWVDTLGAHEVTALAPITSAQIATAAATDLVSSEALANALKAGFNLLQNDVKALHDALVTAGFIAA